GLERRASDLREQIELRLERTGPSGLVRPSCPTLFSARGAPPPLARAAGLEDSLLARAAGAPIPPLLPFPPNPVLDTPSQTRYLCARANHALNKDRLGDSMRKQVRQITLAAMVAMSAALIAGCSAA